MPPELDYAEMSSDIVYKGNLRKAKTWNKRFFVLREGNPARLEYYDSERKWKSNGGKPKRRLLLENPWNIDKKKDCKHEFLIVIFTEDEYISLAAETAEIQDAWINALRRVVKPEPGHIMFKHMWHVNVDSRDLEWCKSNPPMNLHGPHRVCLTHDHMVFIHANANGGSDFSKGCTFEISLIRVRAYGHKEGAFFIEPGRTCGIENGKLWMDLNDEVMASNMHQTISNIVYYPKQDETQDSRGRSYSSGAIAGRTRSVRSFHNNPPPSQIGMGKLANASSARNRCDSLTVAQMGAGNDSRYRTGSEGEHTMKKPPLLSNGRCAAVGSPGMKVRMRQTYGKRPIVHGHPYTSHSHTASLPSSCNGSSTASSAEHLNFSSTTYDGTMPTVFSSLGNCSLQQSDDYVGINNSAQDPSARQNGEMNYQRQANRFAESNDFQDLQPLPHQDGVEEASRLVCAKCFNPITCHWPIFTPELAPPPPDIDPPHYPNNISYSGREYVNVSAHSRGLSGDETLSCDTPLSSLSASPQQAYNSSSSKRIPIQKSGSTATAVTSPSSPRVHSSLLSSAPSMGYSIDEYTSMSSRGKYPHEKSSWGIQKSSSSSIFAKLSSIAGVSCESKKRENYSDSDYTQMSLTSPAADDRAQSRTEKLASNDYVPMRSFTIKQSIPQDISYRRCSIPDSSSRASASSSYRSSPPIDSSPAEGYFELQYYCSDCQQQILDQRNAKVGSLLDEDAQGDSERSDSGMHMLDSNSNEIKASSRNAVYSSREKISPSTAADLSNNDVSSSINMQILEDETKRVKVSVPIDTLRANSSSSTIGPDGAEVDGYLPMARFNSAAPDNNTLGSTLSYKYPKRSNMSVSPKSSPPSESFTNSLDRVKRSSSRSNRLKSGWGHYSSGTTKRSHSLRQSSRPLNGKAGDLRINTDSPVTSSPPLSPGGEYVNIDLQKARQQIDSPHIAISDDESLPIRPDCSDAVLTTCS